MESQPLVQNKLTAFSIDAVFWLKDRGFAAFDYARVGFAACAAGCYHLQLKGRHLKRGKQETYPG